MPVRLIPADLPSTTEPESVRMGDAIRVLTGAPHRYCRVGYDSRTLIFQPDGSIGQGRDRMELRWELHELGDRLLLDIWSSSEITCRLSLDADGVWRGSWTSFERMNVEVHPEAE